MAHMWYKFHRYARFLYYNGRILYIHDVTDIVSHIL